MSFLRKLVVLLSGLTLITILLLIASLIPVSKTLGSPSYIKNNLAATNFYDNFLSSINFTGNNKIDLPDSAPSDIDKDLSEIVKKVFTPETLQDTSEAVIDGGFNWLQGKTPLPQFSIDLTNIKTSLTTEISAYLKNRVASLPECSDSFDYNFNVIEATCRPPGVAIDDSIYAQTAGDAIGEIEFLNKGQVTFESFNIKGVKDSNGIWQTAPKYYRWFNLSPVILAAIAACGIALTILLCRNHWRGVKLASHIFLTAGITLLVTSLIIILFVTYGLKGALALPADQAALSENVILPLLRKFLNSNGLWTLDFGALYLLIGLGLYFVSRRFLKKPIPKLSIAQAPLVNPIDHKTNNN